MSVTYHNQGSHIKIVVRRENMNLRCKKQNICAEKVLPKQPFGRLAYMHPSVCSSIKKRSTRTCPHSPTHTQIYIQLIYFPLNQNLVRVTTLMKNTKHVELAQYKNIISTVHTVFKCYAFTQHVR